MKLSLFAVACFGLACEPPRPSVDVVPIGQSQAPPTKPAWRYAPEEIAKRMGDGEVLWSPTARCFASVTWSEDSDGVRFDARVLAVGLPPRVQTFCRPADGCERDIGVMRKALAEWLRNQDDLRGASLVREVGFVPHPDGRRAPFDGKHVEWRGDHLQWVDSITHTILEGGAPAAPGLTTVPAAATLSPDGSQLLVKFVLQHAGLPRMIEAQAYRL